MARRDTADHPPSDPGLPFKRRARRRLVGALVIGLGVAVMLPLILDREPRYPKPDIRVDIPGRDASLPVRVQNEAESSSSPRAPVNADAARAARAEAGRAAEARSAAAGSAPVDTAQAAADARQQSREPMTTQLDVPSDVPPAARAAVPGRSDADAARAAAARAEQSRADAARADAQRQEAQRLEAQRQEALRREAQQRQEAAARASAARAEASKAEPARSQPPAQASSPVQSPRADVPKPVDPGQQARAYPSQNWAVQIGQFARPENARAAEARANGLGLRAYSETLHTAQGDRVRVRAGPFATRAAAEEARNRLIAAGLEAALIAPEAGR